jgi:hypothetical protein
MAGRKTPLQGKYQGSLTEARPHFIDEMGWELFKAHVQEGRSFVQLALDHDLSVFKVREIVWCVDRDMQLARPNEPGSNEVVEGSPLEDLNLSTRARNALREMGFDTVRSLLERDFTLVCRRLGRIGKEEILSALAAHGFHRLPSGSPDPDANIEQVRRRVAMLRAHIERSHQKWLRRVERIENRLRVTNGD